MSKTAAEIMDMFKERGRMAQMDLTDHEISIVLDLTDDGFLKSGLFNQTPRGTPIAATTYWFLPWETRGMEGRLLGGGRSRG